MSDAQLAIFLQLILTQLNTAIDRIEQQLPEEFGLKTGGSNVFFDPKRVRYPILEDLYTLRNDLTDGVKQLEPKSNKMMAVVKTN